VIRALLLEYGLNACALVPHMVFIVDFVARGLGQGISAGSQYWVIYGLGATVGPLITGHLADRTGFGPALRVSFLIEAIAVILPAISTTPAALIVSSLVIGGFTPGIVPLVIGRIHELVPHSPEQQRATWGHATTSFALFQAASAYGFSWLFEHTDGDYSLLFQLGAAAVVMALVIDLVTAATVARNHKDHSEDSG
jgi:predicted MFS family arabinose efflux permease